MVIGSAREAAIEQARLLVAYLNQTPAALIDMHFVDAHLQALGDFARAASDGTGCAAACPARDSERPAEEPGRAT